MTRAAGQFRMGGADIMVYALGPPVDELLDEELDPMCGQLCVVGVAVALAAGVVVVADVLVDGEDPVFAETMVTPPMAAAPIAPARIAAPMTFLSITVPPFWWVTTLTFHSRSRT